MIFEDPTRHRWHVTLAVFGGILFIGAILSVLYIASIVVHPPLPALQDGGDLLALPTNQPTDAPSRETPTTPSKDALPPQLESLIKNTPPSQQSLSQLKKRDGLLVTGFLIQHDADSVRSFKEHSDNIDIVVPDWYRVTQADCVVQQSIDPTISATMHTAHAAIFPRLANGDNARWYGAQMKTILRDPKKRSCLANTVANVVGHTDSQGLTVDMEGLDASDRDNYLAFLSELAGRLHTQNQLLIVAISPDQGTFPPRPIGMLADGVLLMAYDEHYTESAPGPIASQTWFDQSVDAALTSVPADKLLVGIAAYGYDWNTRTRTAAQSLKFQEILWLAKNTKSQPSMDAQSRNMTFTYQDAQKQDHVVWFLDGHTAWNQTETARERHALGVGLWRVGTEDPRFWTVVAYTTGTRPDVSAIPALTSVMQLSQNNGLVRVIGQTGPTHTHVLYDRANRIQEATYPMLPNGYVLENVGKPFPEKSVLFTFDDGPDPYWTPRIMDVLSQYRVPAVFFVVGKEADRYPSIVKDMDRRGFLVGNHTYIHTDPKNITASQLSIELNRTQRIIEYATGKKTALFRVPSSRDANVSGLDDLKLLPDVSNMGYTIVQSDVDARDEERPGVSAIVATVEQGLAQPGNHIVLFHDGGEQDREQTLAALSVLIPKLKAEGYAFKPLDVAASIPKDALSPPITTWERSLAVLYRAFSTLQRNEWMIIFWIFMFTNVLSVLRILFLGTIVLRAEKRHVPFPRRLRAQTVTVLIPAYNEEKTISKTMRSLAASRHRAFVALVINDGSTDRTADVVQAMAKEDPRFRLITKANAGKCAALNLGFQEAKTDLVITIDADTIFHPTTIDELIRPFANPKVDAVCGNVEVGNVHNLLTGFQALEYITAQNFDRRAFDELNCISVVPGATGAWRRQRVIDIGGYEDDTLTEDADISMRLLERGGKIVYSGTARSLTEAPETVSALAKQRFRWSFGTFQCLRKHSPSFFKGTLGWIALPNTLLFQILYPILSPLGDLVFLWSIISGNFSAVFAGYFLFLFMDAAGSLLAFHLDHKPRKLILLIFVQRFFYRQFMYVTAFRSILAILRGTRQGWNKLKREGSVNLQNMAEETVIAETT